MQPWDETVFDEMRALLPPEPAADARDYLDHNEFELAFETAVDHLSEESVPITATGKVPYRLGILLAHGGIEALARGEDGLDRLERCWA
jgi:hypothetical protein